MLHWMQYLPVQYSGTRERAVKMILNILKRRESEEMSLHTGSKYITLCCETKHLL